MSPWNYRVFYQEVHGTPEYFIAEAYYDDDDGKVHSRTQTASYALGETLAELGMDLVHMARALTAPPLDATTFEPIVEAWSFGEQLLGIVAGLTPDSDLSTCQTCGSDLYRTNVDGRWHHPREADHEPHPAAGDD